MVLDQKGQGSTFWVIIAAVIALVVLVVVLFIVGFGLLMEEGGLTGAVVGVQYEGEDDLVNWNKSFDGNGGFDEVRGSCVDSNDNVYFVGEATNIYNSSSDKDFWIKKFYSNGTEDIDNWNLSFDGNDGNDVPYGGCTIDGEDNVYFGGQATNLVGAATNGDLWIKKFNSSGYEYNFTEGWNKSFDGNGDADIVYSVLVEGNDVYVAGTGTDIVGGSSGADWWIKKFNSSGYEYNFTEGWNKTIDAADSHDYAMTLTIDSNSNVYVAGYGTNLVGAATNGDLWIKKFNSSGTENESWNKSFDARGGLDWVAKLGVDSNDNVYAVGFGLNLVGVASSRDWWLKKFWSNGTEDVTNWNKSYDDKPNDWDEAHAITIDSQDNIYVSGYVGSTSGVYDWYIKKFNSSGAEDGTNWNKTIDAAGNWDEAKTMSIDSNDALYVGGYGKNFVTGSSDRDWWIKKFDLDWTAPTVSIVNANVSNLSSGAVVFNVTVTEEDVINAVIFQFTNGTAFNLTASNSSATEWNVSLEMANVDEGTQTVTVWTNDTSNNVNLSESITIRVDRTAPTVTVTCDPVTVGPGEETTCTCSATDGVSGVASRSHTSEVYLPYNAGTYDSFTCTAVDYSGNSGTGTGSYVVTDNSGTSNGGSSGGGGSSIASTTTEDVAEEVVEETVVDEVVEEEISGSGVETAEEAVDVVGKASGEEEKTALFGQAIGLARSVGGKVSSVGLWLIPIFAALIIIGVLVYLKWGDIKKWF